LVECLCDDSSGYIRGAVLFDVFRPVAGAAGWAAGERSMAVRLELRDDAQTLTDARIDEQVAAAASRAAQRLGARLRA
jgi:phenylalanyl-tRNA synthetase beta chain